MLLETLPDRKVTDTIVRDIRERKEALEDGNGGKLPEGSDLEHLLMATGEDEILRVNGRSLLTPAEWRYVRGETDTIEAELLAVPSYNSRHDDHQLTIMKLKDAVAKLEERVGMHDHYFSETGIGVFVEDFGADLIDWLQTITKDLADLQGTVRKAVAN